MRKFIAAMLVTFSSVASANVITVGDLKTMPALGTLGYAPALIGVDAAHRAGASKVSVRESRRAERGGPGMVTTARYFLNNGRCVAYTIATFGGRGTIQVGDDYVIDSIAYMPRLHMILSSPYASVKSIYVECNGVTSLTGIGALESALDGVFEITR